MYRIIATDLDGTLLSSENELTEYTKKTIGMLIEKKIFFVLASGRHHTDVINVRNSLKIKSFMITSNGARVYDLNNKLIFSDDLDENIAFKLLKIKYLDEDIITQVYQNNQWYINNNKIENKFCPSLSSLKYKYFDLNNFKFNKISKIFFTSNNFKKLYDLEKKIISFLGDKVNISFSVPGCLEVISGKTSKSYGLRLISKILGISLDQCVSFGDGMNDKDMLLVSGKSYIMKNANPRLKKELPHVEVIESNNNNGVARCLNDIFIKNKNN